MAKKRHKQKLKRSYGGLHSIAPTLTAVEIVAFSHRHMATRSALELRQLSCGCAIAGV